MDVFVTHRKKYNQWNNSYISPGPTGPVGDVLPNVRYQNCESLPMRFKYNGNQMTRLGQNVCDGLWYSESTGGYGAVAVTDDFYNSNFKSVKNSTWVAENSQRDSEEVGDVPIRLIPRPLESWNLAVATSHNALSTGRGFLPLPQGYPPRGVPRGVGPQSSFIAGADYITYEPTSAPLGVYAPPREESVGRPGAANGATSGSVPEGPACKR